MGWRTGRKRPHGRPRLIWDDLELVMREEWLVTQRWQRTEECEDKAKPKSTRLREVRSKRTVSNFNYNY